MKLSTFKATQKRTRPITNQLLIPRGSTILDKIQEVKTMKFLIPLLVLVCALAQMVACLPDVTGPVSRFLFGGEKFGDCQGVQSISSCRSCCKEHYYTESRFGPSSKGGNYCTCYMKSRKIPRDMQKKN